VFEFMFSNKETVIDSITGLVTAVFGAHDPVALVRHYQIRIYIYKCVCVYIYIFASDRHLFQVISTVN